MKKIAIILSIILLFGIFITGCQSKNNQITEISYGVYEFTFYNTTDIDCVEYEKGTDVWKVNWSLIYYSSFINKSGYHLIVIGDKVRIETGIEVDRIIITFDDNSIYEQEF